MDQKLLFLINWQWTCPALDWLMAVLSSLDVWLPVIVLVLVRAVWLGGFRGRMMVLSVAIVVGIIDGGVVNTIKHSVERPRPHQALIGIRVVSVETTHPRFLALFHMPRTKLSQPGTGPVEGRSFPSGHTVDNFCVALILALFYRRWGWLYFILATAVAYSRIYTGSHWPSDVAASIPLALGLTLLFLALLELVWRRQGSRWMPQTYARNPSLFGAGIVTASGTGPGITAAA